ncbi:MAG: aminotransferase class IV [Opitutaceae bacterium]
MTPEPQFMLDGRLLPGSKARVSILSEGLQHGLGAFETMRVRDGRAIFFEDHAARLRRAAAALGLDARACEGGRERCERLLAVGGERSCALKWVLYGDEEGGTAEALFTRPLPYQEEHYAKGFVLRTMPAVGEGSGLKTLARWPQVLARRQAAAAGADEALFVGPDGDVREGAVTNVFAVERGVLLTPPLDGRILPGIARARVVSLGSAHEAVLPLPRLLAADEVFVTNALLGVMPVSRVDDLLFPLNDNPVTREMRRLFEAEAGVMEGWEGEPAGNPASNLSV